MTNIVFNIACFEQKISVHCDFSDTLNFSNIELVLKFYGQLDIDVLSGDITKLSNPSIVDLTCNSQCTLIL